MKGQIGFPVAALVSALCLLLITSTQTVAQAPNQPVARPAIEAVTKSDCKVFAGNSETFYVTQTFPANSKVLVVELGKDWVAIAPPRGSFSWIRAKFVAEQSDGSAVVKVPSAPVYVGKQGADARYVTQVEAKQNDRLLIVDQQQLRDEDGSDVWFKIVPHRQEVRFVKRADLLVPGQEDNPSSSNQTSERRSSRTNVEGSELPPPMLANAPGAKQNNQADEPAKPGALKSDSSKTPADEPDVPKPLSGLKPIDSKADSPKLPATPGKADVPGKPAPSSSFSQMENGQTGLTSSANSRTANQSPASTQSTKDGDAKRNGDPADGRDTPIQAPKTDLRFPFPELEKDSIQGDVSARVTRVIPPVEPLENENLKSSQESVVKLTDDPKASSTERVKNLYRQLDRMRHRELTTWDLDGAKQIYAQLQKSQLSADDRKLLDQTEQLLRDLEVRRGRLKTTLTQFDRVLEHDQELANKQVALLQEIHVSERKFDAVGRLMPARIELNDGPTYEIRDRNGLATHLVLFRSGFNARRYEGAMVGILGRTLRRNQVNLPVIEVEQVMPIRSAEARPREQK